MFDGHARHSVVSVLEYVSALQPLQTSVVAAVAVETLPAVHCVQASGPMLALNLPATHDVHLVQGGIVHSSPLSQGRHVSVKLGELVSIILN